MNVGIVASGPSLTPEDVAKLREITDLMIAINDSYRIAKDADVLYGTDYRWWRYAIGDVTRDFDGDLWTQRVQWTEEPEKYGIQCMESESAPGLCTEPGKIHTGMNSGFAAINLAGHLTDWDATIYLLGYDMSLDGNRRHWFDDRPENLNVQSNYQNFAKQFATIKPAEYGLEIINVTRRTELKCFPCRDLDQVYDDLRQADLRVAGQFCRVDRSGGRCGDAESTELRPDGDYPAAQVCGG